MRILLFLFLLSCNFAFAQKTHNPFELERYPLDTYTALLNEKSSNFKTELDGLEYYFLVYKAQRVSNPENYFPKPDARREIAATFLRSNFPEGSAIRLIEFLENRGNQESCFALINATTDYEILLPYQFMAAYLTENPFLESQFINKMDEVGMLSDVLKSFGMNAMLAIQSNTKIISQGMQDLIALKYAAYSNGSSNQIANIFAEKCEGFKGIKMEKLLSKSKNKIWICPSASFNFIDQHTQSLYLWGIGFALSESDKSLSETIMKTGRNFEGLNDIAQTPADRGLIQSYSYFAKAYQTYVLENGEDFDRTKSGKISLYIKNQTE